ncbi:MAG: two-component system sensor kinase FixL [Halioglobus sp.]
MGIEVLSSPLNERGSFGEWRFLMSKPQLAHTPFFALLDAAVDGIVLIDEKGTIERVNPAVERLFGYSFEELVGQNVKLMMPDPDRAHHDSYLQNYLDTGERKIIGIGRETTARRKDASCFPIYLSVGHITEPAHKGFVGILRDLTSQRAKEREIAQTELEIRQLRERLVHVARVSTLGEMVTGIAHEVNQPLTAIATYAQGCRRMIDGGLKDPSELLDALDAIATQAERAATVISRIRNFSRRSEVVQKVCNCADILEEVIALAKVYAVETQVSIETNFDTAEPALVMVDPIQVQQITLNLINNAIESMETLTGEKRVVVSIQRLSEAEIEVSVADHGTGIAQELEEKIFDTFFSTKPSGLGVGLAICQSMVQAQGGIISVEPNEEIGCVFSFTLPTAVGSKL